MFPHDTVDADQVLWDDTLEDIIPFPTAPTLYSTSTGQSSLDSRVNGRYLAHTEMNV